MSTNHNDPDPHADPQGNQAAANLVRSRIEELYALYEKEEKQGTHTHDQSLIDRFWHINHSHPNPHLAWTEYYDGLSPDDKHRIWEEYHLRTGELSGIAIPSATAMPAPTAETSMTAGMNTVAAMRERITGRLKKDTQTQGRFKRFLKSHVWPVVSSAIVVGFVWIVFNNELIVASVRNYVAPGNTSLTPVVIDPSLKVGKESRIIIPKLNVDVPVVYDVKSYNEADIQEGLERGVVHYGDTALPGQIGNNVIVGHSSNNFFNGGKYKFAFVLLSKLEIGDTFVLNYKGERYVYKVSLKKVIDPSDFSLVQPTKVPTATLITCDPPGTSWHRLVIQGEQISPNPNEAKKASNTAVDPSETVVPGNAPSLWDTVRDAIF